MASRRSMPALAGVEHRFVDVGGVRLHVATAGTGPPLVLLHGWPQHWWCWRHVIGELARHHRVLAPDLRGFGWSDAPAGDYAKSTFAADIVALLDREGIDRAAIIGHDWGGYTAFLLALEFPERVERVLGLDIVVIFGHEMQRLGGRTPDRSFLGDLENTAIDSAGMLLTASGSKGLGGDLKRATWYDDAREASGGWRKVAVSPKLTGDLARMFPAGSQESVYRAAAYIGAVHTVSSLPSDVSGVMQVVRCPVKRHDDSSWVVREFKSGGDILHDVSTVRGAANDVTGTFEVGQAL